MGDLGSLETLDLRNCILTNEGTPGELGRLHSLKKLSLQYNKFAQVPAGFVDFAQLAELEMHHCGDLREARCFPSTLRKLDLGNCPNLEVISGLDSLIRLKELVVCNCLQLEELNGLEALQLLTQLNISGCTKLCSAAGLYALTSLKKLFLSGSGLVPTNDCVERLPSIQVVSTYGSDMPECFKNCMQGEIDGVEYADHELMRVQIPRRPCIALLFCFVSHDQGWSDEVWDHSSYRHSYTRVEASVRRNGRLIRLERLFQNRHADSREQMHVCVVKGKHPLLSILQAEDEVEIRARSHFQAWRISVMQASVVLVHGERELEGHLRTISRGLRWESLRTAMWASLVQGDDNTLRRLAALDPAGNTEVAVLKASLTEPQKVQRLGLVWQPNENCTFGNKKVICADVDGRLRWCRVPRFCFGSLGFPNFTGAQITSEECFHHLFPISRFGELEFILLRLDPLGRTENHDPPQMSHVQLVTTDSPHLLNVVCHNIGNAIRPSTPQDTIEAQNHLKLVCRNIGTDLRLSITPQGPIQVQNQLYSHAFWL